jgi:beta-mannosidase
VAAYAERRLRNGAALGPVPSLVATARVRDYAPGEGEAAGAATSGHDDRDWATVAVPGDVHRALIDAGRIRDPFYDRDEGECAWMEEREWWYRFAFDGPADDPGDGVRLRLVFHGLDTYATVWLNETELGRHRNMFREAVFDVTELVRPGEPNTVAVRFDPPLAHAGPALPGQWAPNNHERVWMRKAQFGYGWDWGPRLPTIGLWRPVELRRERRAVLTGVRADVVELAPDHSHALVAVHVGAERFATEGELTAVVRLTPPGEEPVESTVTLRDGHAAAYLSIAEPLLWWTHDLGEPVLHELRVTLDEDGTELDARELQVGLRTLTLDQSPDPDEPGTRFFRFVLNGVALFARGANWIPVDSFVGAIAPERYAERLQDAREANMNMVRVWGGGIYEHDVFYDLCDGLGLLVWQDFMFACAMYPDEDAQLAREVELEARSQVARLRAHPSLALWCGNNENQWIHDRTFWEREGERVPGARFYHEVLPRVVAELDPQRPYWPGSPFGGSDHNSREEGNVHNWEVWHGNYPRRFGERARRELTPEHVAFTRYAEDSGRFISEFGVLSAPDRETLRRWIPSEQLHHRSPALDHHTKDRPKDKIDTLLVTVTGLADDLDEFVDYSMIAQAEAMKFGVEHFRRRKPHCSGTIVWQLDDCWPGLSWSLVDYHGFRKAAWWALRRAYAPVLASFRADGDALELWITNDTLARVRDEARVRVATFAGDVAHEELVPVDVSAGESRRVGRWDAGALAGGADRYLHVEAGAGAFAPNRHFFAAIKDLEREPARLEHSVDVAPGGGLRVQLRAERYAYFVHLGLRDERARAGDDYFELQPGEERTVLVTHPDRVLVPDDVAVRAR